MTSNNRLSWPVKVLMLVGMMLLALFAIALVVMVVFGANNTGKVAQATTMVLQNLVVFILPVVVLAVMCHKSEGRSLASTMWMTRAPSLKSLALVILVLIVAMPMMNYLVDWNQNIKLPASMKSLEQAMRDMEDSAQLVTQGLLNTGSWATMLLMVLVVGVLTGMGEEIFFRAGLLGSMHHGGVNRHVAVWTVALIFSAFHMQFFGFVPRLLLGAWFGYLMLWSGEVWTPIIGHALNNSFVVVMTFLSNNHYIEKNYIDNLGVPQAGSTPWLALASALVTALVIFVFMHKKRTFTTSHNN